MPCHVYKRVVFALFLTLCNLSCVLQVKRAKTSNRYYQAPHLTQDTNGKVTTSHLDITNESQEVSPFPACDPKASILRRARKHNRNMTQINKSFTKEAVPWNGQ